MHEGHEQQTRETLRQAAAHAQTETATGETAIAATDTSCAASLKRRTFVTGATATLLVLGTGALAVAARRGGVGGPGAPPPAVSPTAPIVAGGVTGAPAVMPTATPGTNEAASSYVATAPRTLRADGVETIAFTLANGDRPTTTKVAVALLKDGKTVASGEEWVSGRGSVPLGLPNLAAGDYTLRVSGRGFADEGTVRVESGTILFLESDKPIYKPGETVRLRVLSLNSALRPVAGQATVEAADAKGIKIFRKIVAVDEWGMATLELPLSIEPNLGVWKLRATTGTGAGAGGTQLDIRVERYALPKYEVKVTLPKVWALVTEPITGTIGAEYSFGKPVKGEATIVALRYQGTWQEYARLTRPLDGTATFEIPAARYSAGAPGNGGAGAVRLDVTVREAATDYEEQHSTLVTIVAAPVAVRLIPESGSFKPGLPLGVLVVAAGPDGKAAEVDVALTLNYQDAEYKRLPSETRQVTTKNGVATLTVTPPDGAVVLSAASSFTARGASGKLNGTPLTLRSSYSPTGAFLRVEQLTPGTLSVGGQARFRVTATKEAKSFYYEILSRGKVVYSDVARDSEIVVNLDPVMAPESRLVVYQILPDGEVAADWVGFTVEGALPQRVTLSAEREEVAPGDEVGVTVQTEGAARVGLAAVDRAVFILAENRLNLRAVFDEIERLYGTPQAEAHVEQPAPGGPVPLLAPVDGAVDGVGGAAAPRVAVAPVVVPTSAISPGAKEAFAGAGLLVLTNRKVPAGKVLQVSRAVDNGAVRQAAGAGAPAASSAPAAAAPAATQAAAAVPTEAGALAEPERVRQFFPETWVWSDLTTDPSGKATQRLTAPDSITTWNFRAVALSKDKGLGIGEATLRVFQPFFVTVDLPYAAIRGEEFPVRVALYNYDTTAQEFTVELAAADWFTGLDGRSRTVTVEPQAVGAASFAIRPTGLGIGKLQLAARGRTRADAIIKELIVEPEGVGRERIENLILAAGAPRSLELAAPESAIAGSPRMSVALTGSLLSQTIEGLDSLLQMPYGCGEQNMLLFAPDVSIARYLRETNQAKPEIAAKAELLMLTGYQRELTYRRTDGSYSAFGQRDKSGSLWLTAFVLKTFAQASDLIYIDETVQRASRDWIRGVQQADGAFEQIGFVHHEAMMGGVQGKTALTAYVAIALREASDDATSARAIGWLEGQLAGLADPYALAITAYALGLAQSARAGAARDQLLKLARQTDEGLSWGDDPQPLPLATPTANGAASSVMPRPNDRGRSAATETTAYAALALLVGGDTLNAGRAIRWLAGRRGAKGGFGSTQDTVVALQALTTAATASRADIDATVTLVAGSFRKEVRITPENADVVQIIDLPGDSAALRLETRGSGQPVVQVVQRFNLPAAEVAANSAFALDVRYGAEEVATNDLLSVTATVRYTPPMPQPSGMVVLDVAVPTGFTPETSSLEALAKRAPRLKRWEIAGRKVIFYIEELTPDESLTLAFQARALYPVRAQAVASQAYAYYRPEWRGESLGGKVVVRARG